MLQGNPKTSELREECERTDLDNATLVSVIIPSRNSERTITACLMSIISQSYKPIEIIVVDDFSTDLTREIGQKMGVLVIAHHGERSVAKNYGAKIAKGKYLFFVDADHKLDPGAIATCVNTIDGFDGVLIRDQDISTDSRVSRLIASRRRILSYDPLNIAVRFVSKDAFNRLGGFDLNLYAAEDLDFHKRFLLNGFKMASSQATEWHLGSPVDLRGLLNRNVYYSTNLMKYASKNLLTSLKQLNPLRTVGAWKRSDAPRANLLSVILLGFLSNLFLIIGISLSLSGRVAGEPGATISQDTGG